MVNYWPGAPIDWLRNVIFIVSFLNVGSTLFCYIVFTESVSSSGHRMRAADLLVRALENEGVERIFGVPGEENLDVVESLRRSSIKLVVTRHEQPAAFMAATHG